MVDRETILKMIEAQEKEWESIVKHLQAKATNLEANARLEFDKKMHELKNKLKEAEHQANEVKKTSENAWKDSGDKLIRSWNDMIMNIDSFILRLKK